MVCPEIFRNAPATEALLDIQVALPPEVDLPKLLQFHDLVMETFPEKRERLNFSQGVEIAPDGKPKGIPFSTKVEGYLFVSSNKLKLVQARMSGFTFNKLKPYDRWETFRDEAKVLWDKYRTLFKPANVTRLALRYINRIEIPLPVKEFRDYCLLFPEIPPNMPQGLAEFFMRFVVPETERGPTGIVTVTFEPLKPASTVLPLIFDIDVFQLFEMMSPESEEIWQKFEQLCTFKDTIFFSSVTEKTKELFR